MSPTPKRPALDSPSSGARPAKKGKTLRPIVRQASNSQGSNVVRAVTVCVRRVDNHTSVKRLKNVVRESTTSATHGLNTPGPSPHQDLGDTAAHPGLDTNTESNTVDVPQVPKRRGKPVTTTVSEVQGSVNILWPSLWNYY